MAREDDLFAPLESAIERTGSLRPERRSNDVQDVRNPANLSRGFP
jgi:hypothetical protein